MSGTKTLLRMISLLGLTLALAQPAFAVINSVTYVAGWDSVGSGNPGAVGGPDLVVGQKYVIRISYDDSSATTDDVDVLDAFFSPSGNLMRTIDLTEGSNSLDIFVPMEGLDSGGPFIYQQDETDHFGIFIPAPTLNFANGSSISLTSNIIGLEYEGDFVPGGVFNIIESFNTSPPQPDPPDPNDINMVSQILNCGDVTCATSPGIASNDTNGLAVAVDLMIDAGPDIVYDFANLTQTTSSIVSQSNDLGAARSDSEDFIDASWSQTGATAGPKLNDIAVGIVDSGLTMTTSLTSWNVTMDEQMTLKSDNDPDLPVSYMNAAPTGSASAVATMTGTDFTLMYGDADLAVNGTIAGFEMLMVTALVDAVTDGTAFFTELINTGLQSSTNAALEAAFGTGLHTVVFTVTDKAGASVTPSADFEVVLAVCGNDIVEPGEECDGGACCTSTCEFESAATVCNAGSGDLCDPDELCTGSSAACPADVVAPATTICNAGSGDLCDPDESCSGNPDQACPDDNVAPPTTICNAGSGDLCDPDESCSGNPDEACPDDNVAPATTICNPGSGDLCDPDESCSGNPDEACPADEVASVTTICRPGEDACNLDESCTGESDAACPADDDQPLPMLTVTKFLPNDDGGNLVESDFTIDLEATQDGLPFATSFPGDPIGTEFTLDPGPYTVSETLGVLAEFYAVSYSGDCAVDGTGTLACTDTLECIVINDDIPQQNQGSIQVTQAPWTYVTDPDQTPGGPKDGDLVVELHGEFNVLNVSNNDKNVLLSNYELELTIRENGKGKFKDLATLTETDCEFDPSTPFLLPGAPPDDAVDVEFWCEESVLAGLGIDVGDVLKVNVLVNIFDGHQTFHGAYSQKIQ